MVSSVSPQGAAFTGGNEGFVSHFYRDSGGTGTIGHGFTALSRVFSAYWMQTRGHKLRAGDTITKEESLMLLDKVMDAEYAPPVAKKFGSDLHQTEFDAVADAVYNCGAGTLKDAWAGMLAEGNVISAADRLLTTRITAGGRLLAGLKTRRAREANLLYHGDYGEGIVRPDEEAAQAAAAARAADAQAAKNIAAKTAPASTAGGAATKVAVTKTTVPLATAAFDPNTLYVAAACGLAALVLVGIGYLIYSNRGRILGKRIPS